MKLLSILSLVLMVIMTLCADSLLKIAGTKAHMFNRYFFAGGLVYTLTTFTWYFVLRHVKFSEANAFYGILTVLLSVGIGTILFHEHVTPIEYIGIAMAIGSILILSRFA